MEQTFRATWNARKRLWNSLLGLTGTRASAYGTASLGLTGTRVSAYGTASLGLTGTRVSAYGTTPWARYTEKVPP